MSWSLDNPPRDRTVVIAGLLRGSDCRRVSYTRPVCCAAIFGRLGWRRADGDLIGQPVAPHGVELVIHGWIELPPASFAVASFAPCMVKLEEAA